MEDKKVPEHVAIIMDGNGRWAQERGKKRLEGHKAGVDTVLRIVEKAAQLGVKHLTLYTFSTENWKRPQDEVMGLMTLLKMSMKSFAKKLISKGVRLSLIGDIEGLPKDVQKVLNDMVKKSETNELITVTLALNYGSRQEITIAVQQIAQQVKDGELSVDDISEETVSQNLYTAGTPDPDFLIRTSGELRLSNYLLWQLSYAEFYITDSYWPDFSNEEFEEAINSFGQRKRRFGAVSHK